MLRDIFTVRMYNIIQKIEKKKRLGVLSNIKFTTKELDTIIYFLEHAEKYKNKRQLSETEVALFYTYCTTLEAILKQYGINPYLVSDKSVKSINLSQIKAIKKCMFSINHTSTIVDDLKLYETIIKEGNYNYIISEHRLLLLSDTVLKKIGYTPFKVYKKEDILNRGKVNDVLDVVTFALDKIRYQGITNKTLNLVVLNVEAIKKAYKKYMLNNSKYVYKFTYENNPYYFNIKYLYEGLMLFDCNATKVDVYLSKSNKNGLLLTNGDIQYCIMPLHPSACKDISLSN